MSALAADTETQAGTPSAGSGAALPSIAGNSDFGGDSVAISGQQGQVSPLAGLDMDRLRDAMETLRAAGRRYRADRAGDCLAGVVLAVGADLAGGGFGGGGFGGGGRGNFRGFNPGQPHGAIFWIGSNSALNAEPFSLARAIAGAAALRQQPLRHHVHERAVYAASDQAERQRHDLPDAHRHAQFESAG